MSAKERRQPERRPRVPTPTQKGHRLKWSREADGTARCRNDCGLKVRTRYRKPGYVGAYYEYWAGETAGWVEYVPTCVVR